MMSALLALLAIAQTAQQGDRLKNPGGFEEFQSPMILDTIFLATNRAVWTWGGDHWATSPEYNGLGHFRCNKIAIISLEMQAREVPGAKAAVRFRVRLKNPDQNHDKMVTVLFEVLNGEQTDNAFKLGPLKVKEDAAVSRMIETSLPIAVLKADPRTKLRITMTNWDY
jgi:hypothetical protein